MDAEVVQGLILLCMVEAYHQCGDIHQVVNALVIAPSFAQRVRPIFAFEISGFAPGFDQVVDAGYL